MEKRTSTILMETVLITTLTTLSCLGATQNTQPSTMTGLETLTQSTQKNLGPNGVSQEDIGSLLVECTAYCPGKCCCGKWAKYGKTKTGTDAHTPGIAVDPKVIKLGSKVSIPGIGIRNADDVGGKIKGNRIDVRFPTHAEAKRFGRQTIRVKVIE